MRAKVDAIGERVGDARLALRRLVGVAHWDPAGMPADIEPGLAAALVGPMDPPNTGIGATRRRHTASSWTSVWSRSTRDGEVRVPTT